MKKKMNNIIPAMLVFITTVIIGIVTGCGISTQEEISKQTVSSQAVSGDASVIEKKESEKWEITDVSGNKQKLDVSNVMDINQNVIHMGATYFYYPAEYVQSYKGHYYYMTYNDHAYTIYRDQGKIIGKFKCDKNMLVGCAKYEDNFYVLYKEDSEAQISSVREFGIVDFEKQSIKPLCYTGEFGISIYNYQIYLFYNNEMYIQDFQGNQRKSFDFPEDWYSVSIGEKNLYYDRMEEEKEHVQIFYIDLKTNEKGIVFEYDRDKSLPQFKGASIEKCGDLVYLEEEVGNNEIRRHSCLYIIDNTSKDMQLITSHAEDWTASGQYVFYTDKKHFIHRWDQKSGEDLVIYKKRVGDLKCAGDQLYAREYHIALDDDNYDDCPDDYDAEIEGIEPHIYAMDFEGKNVKKCR